jgi:RecJ-like exonuclease
MRSLEVFGTLKRLEIDACVGCHVFWFDPLESPALSDSAVLDLFKLIHDHRDAVRRPLGARMDCPRCRSGLLRTQDLQRANRIEYFRCPDGCGRLTTFYQFLREKQFVRSLTKAEMQRLRVQVDQIRCSSCGATVAVEKDAACRHCGAAVSILDADAVEKRLFELQVGGGQRLDSPARHPKAEEILRAAERKSRPVFDWKPRHGQAGTRHGQAYDLIDDAIESISGWFH